MLKYVGLRCSPLTKSMLRGRWRLVCAWFCDARFRLQPRNRLLVCAGANGWLNRSRWVESRRIIQFAGGKHVCSRVFTSVYGCFIWIPPGPSWRGLDSVKPRVAHRRGTLLNTLRAIFCLSESYSLPLQWFWTNEPWTDTIVKQLTYTKNAKQIRKRPGVQIRTSSSQLSFPFKIKSKQKVVSKLFNNCISSFSHEPWLANAFITLCPVPFKL